MTKDRAIEMCDDFLRDPYSQELYSIAEIKEFLEFIKVYLKDAIPQDFIWEIIEDRSSKMERSDQLTELLTKWRKYDA